MLRGTNEPTAEELLKFMREEHDISQGRHKLLWTTFQEFVYRLEHGVTISERSYHYFRDCKEEPLAIAMIDDLSHLSDHLKRDLKELHELYRAAGYSEDIIAEWRQIFDDEKKAKEEP